MNFPLFPFASSINWLLVISVAALCLLTVGCGAIMKSSKLKRVTQNEDPDAFSVTRYQKEIDRFKKQRPWFQRSPTHAVLFAGSSTITLWKSLQKDLSPHPIINRGFGGSTLIEQNHYFHDIVKKNQPAQLFLYAGENDLSIGRTVAETHQELVKFLSQCSAELPHTQVVYLAMKPSPSKWYLREEMIKANKLAEEYCKEHPNCTYLDPSDGLIGADGMPDKRYYLDDQLHLSAKGYQVWKKNIKPVLDGMREN